MNETIASSVTRGNRTDGGIEWARPAEDRRNVVFPYIRRLGWGGKEDLRRCHAGVRSLNGVVEEMVDQIYFSSCTLDRLVETATRGQTPERAAAVREEVIRCYQQDTSAIGLAELCLAPSYDIIVVEQGYGGVFVHTVELVKRLRERWRVLLISPTAPLFEQTRHPDDLILTRLRERIEDFSYLSFIHLLRSVVTCIPSRLLLIAHRTMSLYLSDRVTHQPTVIYCDGYCERVFLRARGCTVTPSPALFENILREVYHLCANEASPFQSGGPTVSQNLLLAGWLSLDQAAGNWCWGKDQYENFQALYGSMDGRVRHVPPFVNPGMFSPDKVSRQKVVLYTTTMHNIDQKGFPELVLALQKLPDVVVRCIVRQPEMLPPIPEDVRPRLEIRTLSKPAMVNLYHQVWLNCRVSRQESSPLSILETMICEVPQVVSPTVAVQIPLLEDGVTGFIVEPGDNERLAWALRTLLDDPELRQRMGAACRERAMEYSLDRRQELFLRYLA